MDAEKKLLNFVYQNAEMGVISVDRVLDHADETNPGFVNQLASERAEYLAIHAAAKSALARAGCDEKGLTKLEKLKTYLMIDAQSMTNSTSEHLAEMMVLGSTMGVIDAKKKLREFPNASEDTKGLMQTLCGLEERNVDALKVFL